MSRLSRAHGTSLVDQNKTLVYGTGTDLAKGMGDVAGLVKYRFVSFGNENDLPDPGGLAVMATLRFPTGDKDNLRGLGVTRTALTFIASSGTGRFRPHANGGFEYWSDGVSVASDNPASTVTAQNQIQYAAGFGLKPRRGGPSGSHRRKHPGWRSRGDEARHNTVKWNRILQFACCTARRYFETFTGAGAEGQHQGEASVLGQRVDRLARQRPPRHGHADGRLGFDVLGHRRGYVCALLLTNSRSGCCGTDVRVRRQSKAG